MTNKNFLKIENISKSFGKIKVLENINLNISKSEFFGLLGSSGSGKTTLLRILGGFEIPDSGRIYLDGVDITNLEPFERPLNYKLPKNINFVGFIDVVIRDEIRDRLKIIDIKTSTMGWNKWAKADKNKSNQLLLYKQFYSKQFNFPIDKIDVEFFIVKRKLYENLDFPQRRIQTFVPASGTPSINKVNTALKEFIDECFDEEGKHNEQHIYKKIVSTKNCKYCEFKDKPELCDRKKN